MVGRVQREEAPQRSLLAGSLASVLKDKHALGLSDAQVGASATGYLAGAVIGTLFFGWLTDRLGRKKLFLITLALYLSATAATAFSWNFWSFLLFRVLTGAGIGGEYAAINSAIDELVPAQVRGNVDLVINATFWIGYLFLVLIVRVLSRRPGAQMTPR